MTINTPPDYTDFVNQLAGQFTRVLEPQNRDYANSTGTTPPSRTPATWTTTPTPTRTRSATTPTTTGTSPRRHHGPVPGETRRAHPPPPRGRLPLLQPGGPGLGRRPGAPLRRRRAGRQPGEGEPLKTPDPGQLQPAGERACRKTSPPPTGDTDRPVGPAGPRPTGPLHRPDRPGPGLHLGPPGMHQADNLVDARDWARAHGATKITFRPEPPAFLQPDTPPPPPETPLKRPRGPDGPDETQTPPIRRRNPAGHPGTPHWTGARTSPQTPTPRDRRRPTGTPPAPRRPSPRCRASKTSRPASIRRQPPPHQQGAPTSP